MDNPIFFVNEKKLHITNTKKYFWKKKGKTTMEKIKFVNLTPHAVTIIAGGKILLRIAAGEECARVGVTQEKVGEIEGIPVFKTVYDKMISGLPAPQAGTYYIVSTLVAQAAKDRDDLIVPANLVRDEHGVVIGAEGFQGFH